MLKWLLKYDLQLTNHAIDKTKKPLCFNIGVREKILANIIFSSLLIEIVYLEVTCYYSSTEEIYMSFI